MSKEKKISKAQVKAYRNHVDTGLARTAGNIIDGLNARNASEETLLEAERLETVLLFGGAPEERVCALVALIALAGV